MGSFFASWIAVSLGAIALINSPLPAYAQTGSAPQTTVDSAIAPMALTGVTVIDVETGARRTGVTVLTQGDRIAAIGSQIAIPEGTIRVNGKGKFLIPGFWDMHSHHQGTGAESFRSVHCQGHCRHPRHGRRCGFHFAVARPCQG